MRSALAQAGVAVEVVVVDDGSTDATAAMLSAWQDPRLCIVAHSQPLGVAAARNAAVRHARADWIALLDDDDLWAPDKLRVQLAAVRGREADFAYCAAAHVRPDLAMIRLEAAPDPGSLPDLMMTYNAIPAGSSNVLVRRERLDELGGFDEELCHLADWDLWLRLTRHSRGVACPDALVAYVKHSNNMLGLNGRGFFREFALFAVRHDETIRASGHLLDKVAVARWVAATHRRAGRRSDAAQAYLHAARFGGGRRSIGSALRVLSERRPDVGRRTTPDVAPQWLESYQNCEQACRG